MWVRYQEQGADAPSVILATKVSWKNEKVYIRSADSELEDIVVKGISEETYERFADRLISSHAADFTAYKEHTFREQIH